MTGTDTTQPLTIACSADAWVRQRAAAIAADVGGIIVDTPIGPNDDAVDADLIVWAGTELIGSHDDTFVRVALDRHDPREALVTRTGASLADVARSKTATLLVLSASTRVQVAHRAPDITVLPVTAPEAALTAVTNGEVAAVIAPIWWLLTHSRVAPTLVARPLEHGELLHPIGSGIVSVLCRRADARARKAVAGLHNPHAQAALTAERELRYHITGDSDDTGLYVAGHAEMRRAATGEDRLVLLGLLLTADGYGPYRASHEVGSTEATVLGRAMAATLLAQYQSARDRTTTHQHSATPTGQ